MSTAPKSPLLVLAAALVTVAGSAAAAPCPDPVTILASGSPSGQVCAPDAPRLALTVVDISDDWVPRVLAPDPGQALGYAATYRALAREDSPDPRERFLELWGVFPSFGVLADRLADEERHSCHDAIDDGDLGRFSGTIARDDRTPAAERDGAERRAAVRALQEHLACDQLLAADGADGRFGRRTEAALATYRLRHMVAAAGGADAEVRGLLASDSRELDFRAVLRALRERVVDATGLIEDGSARGEWRLVLGRAIDSPTLHLTGGHPPLERGAPDLVSPAVEAAARSLGWTDPAAARDGIAALRRRGLTRVALALPALPRYHGPAMDLRAEIDRGDVWYDYPLDAAGRRRAQPRDRSPALTLYARDGADQVALVRWPTTIGTWQREKRGGAVVMRYKSSRPGHYLWRDVMAAPVWFAPPSTPDQELVRRTAAGWAVREDTIGPGYRSAYGLVLIVHRNPAGGDTGVRTHGTVSYLSIAEGAASHGCHRLFTFEALRLTGFLLAHRPHLVGGDVREQYRRVVRWRGRRVSIRRDERGYRRELEPPVPVDVLEGRIRGRARQPIQRSY